jgi:hypothetical protein
MPFHVLSALVGGSASVKAKAAVLAAIAVGIPLKLDVRWKPEYASQPIEVQQWYQNAELTRAAQTRFPFKKCCDHADVVKTRFNVNKTTAGDEWYWLDGEKWRRIPDDVIHWGQHAPNGQPTLFIYDGKETCFFPGDGGI